MFVPTRKTIVYFFSLAVLLLISVSTGLSQSAQPAAGKPQPAKSVEGQTPRLALSDVLTDHTGAAWQAQSDYKIDIDPQLQKPVLTVTGSRFILSTEKPVTDNREIQGWLRLQSANGRLATAAITMGRTDIKNVREPSIGINFAGNLTANAITINVTQNGKPLVDPEARNKDLDWQSTYPSNLYYQLRAYNQAMPGWDQDFRIRVEDDMSKLPGVLDKWLHFRILRRPGSLEVWVDDRLIAITKSADLPTAGLDVITLGAAAQLMDVQITTPAKASGFLAVPLAGYANANTLIDGNPTNQSTDPTSDKPAGQSIGQSIDWSTMPKTNTPEKIANIPFVFSGPNPENLDHIDLGKSFLRQGTEPGYHSARGPRLIGAALRDPARIQLRIPYRNYKALHLIVADDQATDSLPVVTAQFYRPSAGFTQNFSASLNSQKAYVQPLNLSVKTAGPDGKPVTLYLLTIPLDPGMLSSFSDLDIFELELTKGIELWRSYPDPISYGYHPSGLPSSLHVYGLTLEETPVDFTFSPDLFGHVWQAGQTPSYTATLTNKTAAPRTGKINVTTQSYDGSETHQTTQPVTLPANAADVKVKLTLPVKRYGYHDVSATLTLDEASLGNTPATPSSTQKIPAESWTENRSLVLLAPDTRTQRWTPGQGALFGYWSYHGAHLTPRGHHIVRLMTLAGARTSLASSLRSALPEDVQKLVDKHWTSPQSTGRIVNVQGWLDNENPDPEKVKVFTAEIIENYKNLQKASPENFQPKEVYFYPEPHISQRLTAGNNPEYWGEKPYELTEQEQTQLNRFFHTSRLAAQTFRKEFPDLKILIPWGDPGFIWPLLRAGFPTQLIDGAGIDVPGFERIPERQLHEQSLHRFYVMRKEFERAGIKNPQLNFCEGIFVPTEPGAVTWREQMDIYTRSTLISMAYGIDRFYSSWFAFDCASYYGAEHYGGCGIQRRIPYCDPKPAYAAYATMTQQLNAANFDGWIKTGSLSTYCLQFKKPDGSYVYTLWTLRGKRPVTITLDHKTTIDSPVTAVESMGNPITLPNPTIRDGKTFITLQTDPSVIFVSTGKTPISSITLGEPDHSDAKPAPTAKPLANPGQGHWTLTNQRDLILENNHFAVMHYLGKFEAKPVDEKPMGTALQIKLLKQDKEHQLMPWYNTLKPPAPITIPGAPSKLGMWVKADSDWGRFIYVLKDARGEAWYSIGEKNQYNCDDVHSWSMFNFDGWRYLTFELPGNSPWDRFRKPGTNWWRFTAEGVVDLPLTLDSIIIQQRTHALYVNDIQPVQSDTVTLGEILVEYESPQDSTGEAVRLSKLHMPLPTNIPPLPNPIADLETKSTAPPTKITRLAEPSHVYDGTRMHFHFEPVEGAARYYLYCGPYADGRGAVNMTPAGLQNGQLVRGFRPGIPMHFWIIWEDKDKKLSKPSPVFTQVLVDNFKEK